MRNKHGQLDTNHPTDVGFGPTHCFNVIAFNILFIPEAAESGRTLGWLAFKQAKRGDV
jgi:hypothetical protein